MRRALASIILGVGFDVGIWMLSSYLRPNMPNWLVYLLLALGACGVLIGLAMLIWPSKRKGNRPTGVRGDGISAETVKNSPVAKSGAGGNSYASAGDLVINNQSPQREDRVKIKVSISPMPRENGKYASIRVYNNHPTNPVYCTGYIVKCEMETKELQEGISWQPIYDLQEPISWDGSSKTPEVKIGAGDHRDLNIAKTEWFFLDDPRSFYFTLASDKPYPHANYKIWVDIICKFGTMIETKPFIGCIYSTGSAGLDIKSCSDIREWEQEAKERN